MSELKEMYQDLEMMNILLDTAREEIVNVKTEMLKDLNKLLYNRFLDLAIKENCHDPIETAKECTRIEITIISKKPILEIFEDLRLYQRLLNKNK